MTKASFLPLLAKAVKESTLAAVVVQFLRRIECIHAFTLSLADHRRRGHVARLDDVSATDRPPGAAAGVDAQDEARNTVMLPFVPASDTPTEILLPTPTSTVAPTPVGEDTPAATPTPTWTAPATIPPTPTLPPPTPIGTVYYLAPAGDDGRRYPPATAGHVRLRRRAFSRRCAGPAGRRLSPEPGARRPRRRARCAHHHSGRARRSGRHRRRLRPCAGPTRSVAGGDA
ncbi:MAG: hypothetical protein R3A10_16665 [Caldilineaceae bacterium]